MAKQLFSEDKIMTEQMIAREKAWVAQIRENLNSDDEKRTAYLNWLRSQVNEGNSIVLSEGLGTCNMFDKRYFEEQKKQSRLKALYSYLRKQRIKAYARLLAEGV